MLSATIERRLAPDWPTAPFGYKPYEGQKHVKLVAGGGDVLAAFGDYSGTANGQGTDNSHPEVYRYRAQGDAWSTLVDRKKADTTPGWPRGVCRAGACWDSRRGVMWKTGGDERLNSYPPTMVSGGLWAFRKSDNTWHKVGPSHTGGSTYNLAWCDVTNALYVIASGAVIKYDLAGVVIGDGIERNNWTVIASPVSDSYLYNDHHFPVDRQRNRIVFYAPQRQETWAYYTATREFRKLNSQPLPVECYYQAHYISAIDRVVLFSGLTEEAYQVGNIVNHQIFALDPQTEQWSVVPTTGPDFLHANAFYFGLGAAYDEVNDCAVVIATSMDTKINPIKGSNNVSLIRFSQSDPVPPDPEPPMPTTIIVPVAGTYVLQEDTPPPVNQPPSVGLSVNATNVTVPATVTLTALASDPDGTLTKVEFLVGGTLIATDTALPFTFDVNITVAGTYSATAKAYDNAGGVTESTPVVVTATDVVIPPDPPSGQPSTPGTTLLPIVQTAVEYPGIGPEAITSAWNGAAFDYATNRMFLPVCGGHADFYPNASYQIQIPSGPSVRVHDMTPWGPPPKDANGYYISVPEYADGKPCSRHIYQGACWLPNQQRVMIGHGSTFSSAGSGDQYVGWLDPVTGTWQRKANIPFSPYGLGLWYLPDPLDADKVYCIMGGSIQVYKPSTDTYTPYPSVGSDPLHSFSWACSFSISPDGDWLYATRWGSWHPGHPESWVGSYGPQYANTVLRKRLRQTTPQAWQAMTTTGDNAGLFLNASPGFEPDPERNAIVCWTPGDPANVTILSLNDHSCTKVGIGVTPHTAHTMNGVYGRLRRYAPNSYALMTTPTLPVYTFTLP